MLPFFVCIIADMLDRMTRGVYRSTPHRVRNVSGRDRLSFPFFFDPNFFADVRAIDLPSGETAPDDRGSRWDQSSVHIFQGTYGDYLLGKVGKVFPGLRAKVMSMLGLEVLRLYFTLPHSPLAGEGWGVRGRCARRDGRRCNASQMPSAIPSHSRNTSLFQNRRTSNP